MSPPKKQPAEVILIHPLAPPKPPEGAPCNGCGVCCLLEPCPVGVLVSWRRKGACKLVRWDAAQQQYRCGLLFSGNPEVVDTAKRWPTGQMVGWTPHVHVIRPLRYLWRLWAKRIISSGSGCDASVHVIREDP